MRSPGAVPHPELLCAALLVTLLRAAPAHAVGGALSTVPATPPAVAPLATAPPSPAEVVRPAPMTLEPPRAPVVYGRDSNGTHFGFDVRGEVHSLFKIYDGGADAGGGGGIAASVEVRRVYEPSPSRTAWGGFVVGVGQAFHYDAYSIGGIAPGVLTARGIEGGVTSFLELETSFFLGARIGIGSFESLTRWRGVILGAAWSPTYVYFTGTSRFDGGGAFNPAGFRCSADIGSLDLGRATPEPIFRVTLTWLPYVNDLPTILSLGLGAAFY